MDCTDEQRKIADRIIDALSESEDALLAINDSLIALSIVTGLVIRVAEYTPQQRAAVIGLMVTAIVGAAEPDEEDEEDE